ncbi:MAG: polysaccharide deacetylase family protein [Pseudomonadota bacterium]
MLFVARGLLALGTLLTPCDAFAADVALFDAQDAPPSLLSHCWSAGALAGTERERRSTANRSRVNLDALRAVARPNRIAVPKALRGSIRSVTIPNDEKLIALTFDLCESSGRQSGYDGEVIDYLRAENVRATLFVSGKWFESHPERSAQLIADEALEIGGHGFYHRDFSRASQATLHDEIHLTEAAFLRARGRL